MLATDYLNHFNEVQMLLEMVPDMLDDCKQWKPKSYPQHFLDSGLPYGALAAEIYNHVEPVFKVPFEAAITQMETVILKTVGSLETAIAEQQPVDLMRQQTGEAIGALQEPNQLASTIIHGAAPALDQNNIDKILEA